MQKGLVRDLNAYSFLTPLTITLPEPHGHEFSNKSRIWFKVNFKRSTAGSNKDFSFSFTSWPTKIKEPILPDYLLKDKGKSDVFMSFARALAQSETLSVLARIWIQFSGYIP